MADAEKATLLIVSKLKSAIKDAGCRSGDEFIAALNEQVHKTVLEAVEKCKADKRATLKADDLVILAVG